MLEAVRRPTPTSTSVPVMLRTMCFTKAVASTTIADLRAGHRRPNVDLQPRTSRTACAASQSDAWKAPKSWRPDERRRRGPHGVHVERPEDLPLLEARERGPRRSVPDPVAVPLAARAAAGVEAVRLDRGRTHGDVLRQERVHPLHVCTQRQGRLLGEARHLPGRVDAGVGAARAGDAARRVVERPERTLERGLDRRPVRLHLPPHVTRSVVPDRELHHRHAADASTTLALAARTAVALTP